MFLQFRSDELDNHSIYPDWRLTSDHAPLMIMIPIVEEHIQIRKQMIVKGSEEESVFIKKLIKTFKDIDTSNLSNIERLENVILNLANLMERIWVKTQNQSISQSTLKVCRMLIAAGTWRSIGQTRA